MKETDALDEYILQHIDEEGDYLKALYRATHVKLLRPRMASGHLQGRMLKMFVRMIRPKQVLEIGTYSGYSALCLAEGLEDGAMLHTFEINDEQEDFTRPWLENSPYADRIRFYIGDALEMVPNGRDVRSGFHGRKQAFLCGVLRDDSPEAEPRRIYPCRQYPVGRSCAGGTTSYGYTDHRHQAFQRSGGSRYAGRESHSSDA